MGATVSQLGRQQMPVLLLPVFTGHLPTLRALAPNASNRQPSGTALWDAGRWHLNGMLAVMG
jgi:hypothetical protein